MKRSRIYIIAEAGVNHNGSVAMARRLIDAAADAGADAVKFQTFITEKLVDRGAPKAPYQNRTTGSGESQYEMLKKLELDFAAYEELAAYCQERRIEFLSTPFDVDSLDMLINRLNMPRVKIASGEITNGPLLLAAARTGKPVVLSTGMSTLGEVEDALAVLAFGYTRCDEPLSRRAFRVAYASSAGQDSLNGKVTLLHCTTEYPAPFGDVNLRAMDTLHAAFALPVGISDHTLGIAVAIAAVARGATIVEKHFTLDRTLPGPDHQASLEPDELRSLVTSIRQVEEALGSEHKLPADSEYHNIAAARKSLVAGCTIKKGEPFTTANLAVRRPGGGLSPMCYWQMQGKMAERDYDAGELIEI